MAKKKAKKQKISKGMAALIIILAILFVVAAAFLFIYVSDEGQKSIYKLEYKERIEEYASRFEIDPYLVASVIWAESGYDPEAVSSRGAIGLMQIMPDTGEWIAQKLGEENFEVAKLTDPDVNIRYGCWYLSYLLERFPGQLENVIAGYNAGPNRVQEWLDSEKYSSNGEKLDTIPYSETENYVEKVTKAYDKYKEFYELGQAS